MAMTAPLKPEEKLEHLGQYVEKLLQDDQNPINPWDIDEGEELHAANNVDLLLSKDELKTLNGQQIFDYLALLNNARLVGFSVQVAPAHKAYAEYQKAIPAKLAKQFETDEANPLKDHVVKAAEGKDADSYEGKLLATYLNVQMENLAVAAEAADGEIKDLTSDKAQKFFTKTAEQAQQEAQAKQEAKAPQPQAEQEAKAEQDAEAALKQQLQAAEDKIAKLDAELQGQTQTAKQIESQRDDLEAQVAQLRKAIKANGLPDPTEDSVWNAVTGAGDFLVDSFKPYTRPDLSGKLARTYSWEGIKDGTGEIVYSAGNNLYDTAVGAAKGLAGGPLMTLGLSVPAGGLVIYLHARLLCNLVSKFVQMEAAALAWCTAAAAKGIFVDPAAVVYYGVRKMAGYDQTYRENAEPSVNLFSPFKFDENGKEITVVDGFGNQVKELNWMGKQLAGILQEGELFHGIHDSVANGWGKHEGLLVAFTDFVALHSHIFVKLAALTARTEVASAQVIKQMTKDGIDMTTEGLWQMTKGATSLVVGTPIACVKPFTKAVAAEIQMMAGEGNTQELDVNPKHRGWFSEANGYDQADRAIHWVRQSCRLEAADSEAAEEYTVPVLPTI